MTSSPHAPAGLTIIVATDRNNGIGVNNTLPWHLPEDLAHFKRTTSGHAILMGRKTFDSIGRALPNRRNIVITRNAQWQHAGVEAAASLQSAAALAAGAPAFIIGGAQIYKDALALALVDRLIITRIDQVFDCDAFFPALDLTQWKETARQQHHSDSGGFDYAFVTYERH